MLRTFREVSCPMFVEMLKITEKESQSIGNHPSPRGTSLQRC
jgi:hypothetical protein